MIALALDFGIKKIGVAVGEHITQKARALKILSSRKPTSNWHLIKQLITYWEPYIIIVGLPLNVDGTKQMLTFKVEKFAHILQKKFNIPVKLHDERLSTIAAREMAFNQGGFKGLKKSPIDSIAAVIILESWLSQNHIKKNTQY